MCEQPSVFKSSMRKSRKSHKCCECQKEIIKGELYQYNSGIWDGEPGSFKMCLNCHDLFDYANRVLGCHDEGIAFESLADHFMEYADRNHTTEEALSELSGYFGCTEDSLSLLIKPRLERFCSDRLD